jgi:hypothetical protein
VPTNEAFAKLSAGPVDTLLVLSLGDDVRAQKPFLKPGLDPRVGHCAAGVDFSSRWISN